MYDWTTLDQEWEQRSKRLFQRCVNEPDKTQVQQMWYKACLSELSRLEWKAIIRESLPRVAEH